ncbi:hypothetical protein [Pedobacter nototheniae]|uniref:hypothetical protein n=1 Tax=Pedobacter nototheniae TaxID=2488994 RepID=UPI00292DFA51|nr:hypothetical protein [Pedobacter nototheniae]
MEPIFKSLYHLENSEISIIEIERSDLPANAEIYERFQWIKFDKCTSKITALTFVSMKADEEEQTRIFEGASLKFNFAEASFSENNQVEQVLKNNTEEGISATTEQFITNYLTGVL